MSTITFKYNGTQFINFTLAEALKKGVPENVFNGFAFNKAKADKLAEINATCEHGIGELTATYPASEVTTFNKQESEARAYLDDANAPTPLLDALATHREMDKDELVSRVIEKADAFAAASGAIIGKRQKLEDALNLLTSDANTINDIAAITW